MAKSHTCHRVGLGVGGGFHCGCDMTALFLKLGPVSVGAVLNVKVNILHHRLEAVVNVLSLFERGLSHDGSHGI